MGPIKLYIADHYYLFRQGLRKSLEEYDNIEIVGESEELDHLLTDINNCKPDVLLVELDLCDKPAQQLISEITKSSVLTKVLIVSDCVCELPLLNVVKSAVSGFVRKNVSGEELYNAIAKISTGGRYFSADILDKILALGDNTDSVALSDREYEILHYICKGRSNEQIGDILFLSEKTVATHRRNIMRKASVKKSSDLILWAFDKGLISRN